MYICVLQQTNSTLYRDQVGLAAEKAHDELSQANEQLRVDIEKWHEAKNKEVCQFMRQFATNHREYHQKVGPGSTLGLQSFNMQFVVTWQSGKCYGGICKNMFDI